MNKKQTAILAAVVMLAVAMSGIAVMVVPAAANSPATTYPLVVGGGSPAGATTIGTVTVAQQGSNLVVTYQVTVSNWWLTDTHVAVATKLANIPQSNGNPVPGQFAYKHTLTYATSDTYTIPIKAGTQYYIAAQAGASQPGGITQLGLMLPVANPVSVGMSVDYPGTGSYFTTHITGTSFLTGSYSGWCVDTSHVIYPGSGYTATVYSSYNVPAGLGLTNLPEVNYIINQHYVGQTAADGNPFTMGDVQVAIWTVLGLPISDSDTSTVGAYTPAHVSQIVTGAQTNGASFVPTCGGLVALVVVPNGGDVQIITAQVTIAQFSIPCGASSGTGWACLGQTVNGVLQPVWSGKTLQTPFSGKNWATYVTYTTA